MILLGLSCYNRESAACLLDDGEVVAAALESSFTRDERHSVFPAQALNFCLQQGNKTIIDVDYIVIPEKPYIRFERVLVSHIKAFPCSINEFIKSMPSWLEDRLIIPIKLKKDFAFEGKVLFIKHHLAHVAGAFYSSPFEKSAILTADGSGEWATLKIATGEGNDINILKEIKYPNSLGLLYAAITNLLGFEPFKDEDKVMNLSCYGKPNYIDRFKEIVISKPDGSFMLDERYFNFLNQSRLYRKKLTSLLTKERLPGDDIEEVHCDIAASLQKLVEGILVDMSKRLYEMTKTENLCLSGGIFNNIKINQRIIEDTPFKDIFIQQTPGNAGTTIGAAKYIYHCILGNQRKFDVTSPFLGSEYTQIRIKRLLTNRGAEFEEVSPESIPTLAAKMLSDDKLVAWFQGRTEFGNYGLGNRNILGNPCSTGMKEHLRKKIGLQERVSEFGVLILQDKVHNYFEKSLTNVYKSLPFKVKKSMKEKIPSAVQADGTANVQTLTEGSNKILFEIVNCFQDITGIPMVLSTSFRDANNILISSPEEAYDTFERMNLDNLIIGNFIVEKK